MRPLAIATLLLIASCAGTGAGSADADPRPARTSPDRLVERQLNREQITQLQELEQLWATGDESFLSKRDELFAADAALAPWFAKAMTRAAVLGYDDLQSRGSAPEPERFAEDPHPFFRACRELAALGKPGADALRHYLLRDSRGANRKVGVLAMLAFDEAARVELIAKELESGPSVSRRAALEGLAGLRSERVGVLLRQAAEDRDWQLRGVSLPIYAQWLRGRVEVSREARLFWNLHERDTDPFVRRKALEALGYLGDASQVRPLVDALEASVKKNDARAAESAATALRSLTRKRYGTQVHAWRVWLGDR
jgi:hypothetical protein